MSSSDLQRRGEQNVADASFVRQHFIPRALEAERWNIVVYECFRVAELLLKGMILLSGEPHKRKHDLPELIDTFLSVLAKRREGGLEPYVAFNADGNWYSVHVAGGRLELLKRVNGFYTLLGRSGIIDLSIETLLRVRLEVDGSIIAIWVGDRVLLRTADCSIQGPFTSKRVFVRDPEEAGLARLRSAVKALREQRTLAFFGERSHSQDEAQSALRSLDEVLQAGLVFFPIGGSA